MMSEERASARRVMLHDKITCQHHDRLAIVDVRQSTLQQVERHQESTRLRYALVDRAADLGWEPGRITVIDDDLGRSGSTIEGRLGFQRLVAEVGLGNVGLVLGVEMSRLARTGTGISCWRFVRYSTRSSPIAMGCTTRGISTTGCCLD
jgi:DNA invertase Pin-like site-specific DNA recombinase